MFRQMISNLNIKPTGLSIDSRTLNPGEIFFALNANPDYIDQAVQKGASAVLTEILPCKKYSHSIPVILVKNLSEKIGLFASEFYGYPSEHKNLHITAITGTNGKTSCSHFLAQALAWAGYKTAVIGTLGNGPLNALQKSLYTTPDAICLQKTLADFVQAKIEFAAIEASSHGLSQGRILGTRIETAVFTNLTQDHLDYHETMENYARAKFSLFEHPGLKQAVFNLDDPYGAKWANKLQARADINILGVSTSSRPINPAAPSIIAEHINISRKGLSAQIMTPWGKNHLETSLWGKFNLSNLLCVLAVLLFYKIPLQEALGYLSRIKNIPGRLQLFQEPKKPLIIIDYAHTPDALLKALQTIREHCADTLNHLWCIFGCGGNRDKSKRPQMGRIAEQYADQIILTNDNPRNEAPLEIIHDISEGFIGENKKPVIIELDRRKAIQHAVAAAQPDDVILIAGKGHETYQEMGDQKTAYSDILTVKMLLLD